MTQTRGRDGSPAGRRLLVRLCNYVGDVVLGLPALQLLAAHGHELHLYGPRWAGRLLAGTGWPCHVRSGGWLERVRTLRALQQQWQAESVTPHALIMPNSLSSALELRLGGFQCHGYGRDGRGLLLTQVLPESGQPHELEMFWQLACAMTGQSLSPPGQIHLPTTAAARERVAGLRLRDGSPLGERPYLCVVPFSGGLVVGKPKRWPHFPELVRRLIASGHPVVICPGPQEQEEAQQLYADANCLPGVGLDDYAVLLAQSLLVVANDTGPGHMAAAVGARQVSILGPTDPAKWRPWGPRVRMVTHHPDWPTLQEVEDEVMRALEEARAATSHASTPGRSVA